MAESETLKSDSGDHSSITRTFMSNCSSGELQPAKFTTNSQQSPIDESFAKHITALLRSKAPRRIALTPKEIWKLSMPYVTRALRFLNKQSDIKYVLENPGMCTSALIKGACVHHMNFKVKEKGKPDAPVMMFFAELISLGPRVPRVEICECLGPEEAVTEEPKNYGCRFCSPGILHHPSTGGFKTGQKNTHT